VKQGGLTISKGTFDKDAITTQNSLYANSLQYPEIARTLLMLQPQYSLTNITAPFIQSEEMAVGDLKFEYPVIGRTDKPLTCTGTAPTGDGKGDSIVYIEVEENYAHPTWEYKLGEDVLLRVDSTVLVKKTVKGYLVPFKIMGNDNTDTISSSDIYAQRRLGKVANSNTEYSERGYGAQQYPDWLANYLTTTRKQQTVTGDAATSILWLQKGDYKLWAIGASPDELMNELGQRDGGFLWDMEKDAWFGRTTMDENGICTKTDNGKPLVRGNGFLQQIQSNMTDEFSKGQLTQKMLLNHIRDFKIAAGINGGKITVHTGAGGVAAWYELLANFYLHQGNQGIVYTMDNGRKVTVGEDIPTVHLLNCDITIFENPILTDPLNNDTDDEGLSLLGQSYFFVDGNTTMGTDGKQIPTVQKMVRKANGIDRSMIVKVVDGMVNPVDPMRIFAASARDGYTIEWLSQWMLTLRKINGVSALFCTG